MDSSKPEELVAKLYATGMTDEEVRLQLEEFGLSSREIHQLMKQAKKLHEEHGKDSVNEQAERTEPNKETIKSLIPPKDDSKLPLASEKPEELQQLEDIHGVFGSPHKGSGFDDVPAPDALSEDESQKLDDLKKWAGAGPPSAPETSHHRHGREPKEEKPKKEEKEKKEKKGGLFSGLFKKKEKKGGLFSGLFKKKEKKDDKEAKEPEKAHAPEKRDEESMRMKYGPPGDKGMQKTAKEEPKDKKDEKKDDKKENKKKDKGKKKSKKDELDEKTLKRLSLIKQAISKPVLSDERPSQQEEALEPRIWKDEQTKDHSEEDFELIPEKEESDDSNKDNLTQEEQEKMDQETAKRLTEGMEGLQSDMSSIKELLETLRDLNIKLIEIMEKR